MKRSTHSAKHSTYSQEYRQDFLANPNHFLRLKSDLNDLCSPAAFLFQEKLPIIYANIRVWIRIDLFLK